MMKTLITLLALLPLTASAVQADIRYPNTAGAEFCLLRSRGVTKDQALEAAVIAGWDDDFTATTYTREDGTTIDSDVIEMTDYIATMCPEAL